MGSKSLALTPDEQLAALIVDKLVEESLIRERDAEEVKSLVSTGKASPEEWTFWIERALTRRQREVTHGTD